LNIDKKEWSKIELADADAELLKRSYFQAVAFKRTVLVHGGIKYTGSGF
jgi:hypothetical protein